MENRIVRMSLIVVCLGIFNLSTIVNAEEKIKIGYVNLIKVFNAYNYTKDADAQLEKKGIKKEEERKKMVEEIKRLREEMELLSEEAKKEKKYVIDDKVKALSDFDESVKKELLRERDKMVKEIFDKITTTVEDYGRENDYSIILNDRVLLYTDKRYDLSEAIIKDLNRDYRKKK